MHQSPFLQFSLWFEEALNAEVVEPNAMALATATLQGTPSCRMVLMKAVDETGFTFFTNIYSKKGQELTANPQASATFWWKELERQVLISGTAAPVPKEEARAYFAKRPHTSQLGTRTSRQDEAVPSREFLEKEYQRLEGLYKNQPVPLPADWGGFKIIPRRFEFWQGRTGRLHDRFSYTLTKDEWVVERLSP